MSTTDTAPVVACDRLVHTYRTGRDRVLRCKGST